MPYAQAHGARLYYEESGAGLPIIFAHEFAADYRTWEGRCASSPPVPLHRLQRAGLSPSEVPTDGNRYGQAQAADDILAVLDHLGVGQAHVVGLSMGGGAALHFGLRHPRARSARRRPAQGQDP
jgi:pimeloyl-ACP methyl ester carboxylesterase